MLLSERQKMNADKDMKKREYCTVFAEMQFTKSHWEKSCYGKQ
jgi:hypothetical protein